MRRRLRSMVAIGLVLAAGSACAGASGASDRIRGATLEVLAGWTGTEQARFEDVISGFEAATGVRVTYTPVDDVPAAVEARVGVASPPDVAFLPQPGVLRDYAARGLLVPLDDATVRLAKRNYGAVWNGLASAGGTLYGIWFKAANKSLVWYNVGAFERAGVVPPDDVTRLGEVARTLGASGVPAFAVGGGEPWTLTDWFENLYLRVAGPARYDLLADHRIPWTDPSVLDTLRLQAQLLAPDLLAGGVTGASTMNFTASVDAVFASPPAAAMTAEGDFVPGVLPASTHRGLGVNVDVFAFPAVGSSGPAVVGGGDVAVILRRSLAAAAFLQYVASPAAAARWAAHGGFVSPNVNLDLNVYPDDITRSIARSLLEAGDAFRFDLSDLQPRSFGSTPSAGMEGELRNLLVTGDVDGTAARLEEAATAAFGR